MRQPIEQILASELSAGERLLWSGSPRKGIALRSSDLFLIPFSILWGGFAFFWEYSVYTSKAPLFFKLWGIPFILVGIYFIFGRFIVEAKQRENISYGLTTQRVIIVTGSRTRKVKSLQLKTLTDLSLSEKSDRTGTITFGPLNPMYAWFGATSWPGMGQHQTPSFDMIENAKMVYEKIRSAQNDA